MKKDKTYNTIIVGGGFYGCMLALFFKEKGGSVAILEKEKDLLMRASYNNQARVHNGYHYPRSFLTALRSHQNFARFVKDFKETVVDNFQKVYAIASGVSKVTSLQFGKFCKQIGAPVEVAPLHIKKIFNSNLVEEVFKVEEYVFDAKKLRKILKNKLKKAGVKILFKNQVNKLEEGKGGDLTLILGNGKIMHSKQVFNCTYSSINNILKNSNLPLLPFKHEWTEMPLLAVPAQLKNLGITIVDGPFFSLMPFPSLKLHTLHHVRYTPHFSWVDGEIKVKKLPRKSRFLYMIKDAERFIPLLKETKYKDSIFEIKTVLEEAEESDKRPILYRKNYGMENLHIIMGGKIDNIYDCLAELKKDVFEKPQTLSPKN